MVLAAGDITIPILLINFSRSLSPSAQPNQPPGPADSASGILASSPSLMTATIARIDYLSSEPLQALPAGFSVRSVLPEISTPRSFLPYCDTILLETPNSIGVVLLLG